MAGVDVKVMRLRWAGRCQCGETVRAGETGGWDRVQRRVYCERCLLLVLPATAEASTPARTSAGESLEREYERRVRNRAEKAAAGSRWGRIRYRLSDEPASTKAFATGARGERVAAERMARPGDPVVVLHSRRMGRNVRYGDIDHIAIAPTGIWVINTKHYKGARVRVRRTGGLFSPVKEKLVIAGRDRTSVLDGIGRQRAVVAEAIAAHPRAYSVPVWPILNFVDADLPMFETPEIHGVRLVGSRQLRRLLCAAGPLGETRREELMLYFDTEFPPA